MTTRAQAVSKEGKRMKFFDQKIVGGPDKGDCFIACLCTALEIPYDASASYLLELVAANEQDWLALAHGFACAHGRRLVWQTDPKDVPSDALCVVGGTSPRPCKAGHSVLMRGAGPEVLHDPHPSRAGIVGEPHFWMYFTPIAATRAQADRRSSIVRACVWLALGAIIAAIAPLLWGL